MKCEDLDKVIIGDDLERFFQVGARLPLQEKEKLVELLRRNVDVFVWDAYKALSLDPKFICHRLNVDPSVTPKKQPPRRPSNEHVEAIKSEVLNLNRQGLLKRYSTLSGWQIPWWSRRRQENGVSVWTLQILTRLATKTHSLCRG